MPLGNVNIRVGNNVATIGRVHIQLPNSSPSAQLPITLKNTAGDVPTVEQLRDVEAPNVQHGDALIYNSNTGLWVAGAPTANLSNIDGGSF